MEYYYWLFIEVKKITNETNKFLERHQLLKLTQTNLNKHITRGWISDNKLPTKKDTKIAPLVNSIN
jgi:hypothetical protein